jgi:5'(3')-deoxyribonucleotidase
MQQDEKKGHVAAPASKKIILIDMDGVLADMDAKILQLTQVDVSKRLTPDIPEPPATAVKKEWVKPGFFLSLPLVPDAKVAVRALLEDKRYDVRFCTAPLSSCETCASEKIAWIRKHFGQSASRRVIITDDKTLIRGWILIDDRNPGKGDHVPEWKHVVFDHASNQNLAGPRLRGWTDLARLWKELGQE